MNPGQVRVLIDKYEVLLKEAEKIERAVKKSKESKARIMLRILSETEQTGDFPLEFNLELGQALYQAKLDQHMEELREIKKRMGIWS